jgi:CSLREA domain-containing protein
MAKVGHVTRQQRRALERKQKKSGRTASELAAGAAIAIGAAAFAGSAGAATIMVNSTADVVADDGACTLREAIRSANQDAASGITPGECAAGSGLDDVDLTTVSGTILLKPLDPSTSAYGGLYVETSMNITGPGAGTLSISGGGATGIFYMYAQDPAGIDVRVSGVTLTDGHALQTNPFNGAGGAIFASSPDPIRLTVTDSVFTGNVADHGGGAIAFSSGFNFKYGGTSTPGSLTVTNSTFTNNVSNLPGPAAFPGYLSGSGGAISIKYASDGTTVLLDHLTISGNRSQYDGGGIAANLSCAASLTISNSIITGNDAGLIAADIVNPPDSYAYFSGAGGGIALNDLAASGLYGPPAVVQKNGRKARTSKAKGLATPYCSNVLIQDSTISSNSADYGGAGVYAHHVGLTVNRTTISGNTIGANGSGSLYGRGGGILFYEAFGDITDSTIANNSAYYGGGIYAYGAPLTINNTTISGNTATASGGFGSGIALYSNNSDTAPTNNSTLNNSIVANNTPGATQLSTGGKSTLTVTFTDVFPADPAPTWTGSNNLSVDPLLSALTPSGTPNQGAGSTNAPLVEFPSGPVIDAGDTATAALPNDERNFPRVAGAAVDLGAVEVVPSVLDFSSPTYTVTENGVIATITVTRTGGTDTNVSVAYTTSNGTATAGADYTTAAGVLTWAAGDATPKTFTVPIIDDLLVEPPETVNLTLSTPTGGATIGTGAAVLTITDFEPGVVSFSSPTYTVTENGVTATITVTRTGGTDNAVSVAYATSNGTAAAGSDYTATNGVLTWAAGDATPKTFTVPIIDDTVPEASETVNLTLSTPTGGATIGTGAAVLTITDFEPGTVTAAPVITVDEAAGTVTITVNRGNGSSGPLTVDFSTTPGTATAPADFTATTGTLTWADGDATPKTITIPITVDTTPEPPETFTVNLSSTTAGAVVGTPVVTVTIVEPAAVPTMAFWMKLMLALTCAGVGVVMLKNGRLLVVVLAAGVAVATATPVRAAVAPKTNSRAGRHAEAPAVGTVQSVTATSEKVTLTIGTTQITAPKKRVMVIDARNGHQRVGVAALKQGTPILYRVVRAGDGSVRRMRIGIFESTDKATAALKKFRNGRNP